MLPTHKKRYSKRTKIRVKLVRSTLACTTLFVIAVSICVSMLTRLIVVSTSLSRIDEAVQYQADRISSDIHGVADMMLTYKALLHDNKNMSDSEILEILGMTRGEYHGRGELMPTGLYVGNGEENKLLISGGFEPSDDFIVAERSWYKNGMESEGIVIGEPFVDVITGDIVAGMSCKLNENEVIAADLFLNGITDRIEKLDLPGDGTIFICDSVNGHMIADVNRQQIGMTLKDITEAANSATMDAVYNFVMNKENLDKEAKTIKSADGTKYKIQMKSIENTNWVAVVFTNESYMLRGISKLYQIIFGSALVAMSITGLVIYIVIAKTTKPLKYINEAIQQMTEGNFLYEVKPTGNDEITTLMDRLKVYMEHMRGVMSGFSALASNLSAKAIQCKGISEVLSTTSSSSSEAMSQMDTTVTELAKAISEVADNATTLANAVEEVSGNSKEAHDMMDNAMIAINEGKKDIEETNSKMGCIANTIEDLDATVKEVGEAAKRIVEFADVIKSIAEQTNLLSLNASIEAARAGDSGRGFSVVAGEIGKLANECSDAVADITKIVKDINDKAGHTINQTSETKVQIMDTVDLVENTARRFNELYDTASKTERLVYSVSERVDKLEAIAQDVASITEEQSAGTEEILASTDVLNEQIKKLANDSKNLLDIANGVNDASEETGESIKVFKI